MLFQIINLLGVIVLLATVLKYKFELLCLINNIKLLHIKRYCFIYLFSLGFFSNWFDMFSFLIHIFSIFLYIWIIRSQIFQISSTDVKIKAKRKGRPGYNVINFVSFKYHIWGHRGSLHWSQMVELPSTPTWKSNVL